MGILSTILGTLGIGNDETPPSGATPVAAPLTTSAPAVPRQPSPIAVVDVVADLEQRAAANPQKLNWETSIVDLLKLLDMDSSLAERKALANEMGCPMELREDSAKMNMWLHKTVLERIAYNGGNIPEHLLR